ncbi:hypothetical protein PROFUN_15005 [Planoprotostelium fungivorum]|uniref:Pentatricopeptide repeat-containing protein n=1 Tax=Planoprotostelium fungivorum TaxID=1890364 RepID=A0A2P6MY67_9EUKA|nr:hypothetical protein PROFUN_15005 [Planoprotostelium fungivorum]
MLSSCLLHKELLLSRLQSVTLREGKYVHSSMRYNNTMGVFPPMRKMFIHNNRTIKQSSEPIDKKHIRNPATVNYDEIPPMDVDNDDPKLSEKVVKQLRSHAVLLKNAPSERAMMHSFRLLLESKVRPDVHIFTIMVRNYAKWNMLEKAYSVFGMMSKWGIQPNSNTYNTVLQMLLKDGVNPEPFLERMITAEVDNVVTYNMIMSSKREVAQKREWLDKMEQRGIKPDSTTYNILMGTYAIYGDCRKKMVAEGVEADVHTYNSIMRFFSLNRDANNMMKNMNQMIKAGIQPDDVTYEIVLTTFIKDSQTDKSVRCNPSTFKMITTYFEKIGRKRERHRTGKNKPNGVPVIPCEFLLSLVHGWMGLFAAIKRADAQR